MASPLGTVAGQECLVSIRPERRKDLARNADVDVAIPTPRPQKPEPVTGDDEEFDATATRVALHEHLLLRRKTLLPHARALRVVSSPSRLRGCGMKWPAPLERGSRRGPSRAGTRAGSSNCATGIATPAPPCRDALRRRAPYPSFHACSDPARR